MNLFLGMYWRSKPLKILIAATLKDGKWPGKVGGALNMFINIGMPRKLFALVKGQRLHPGSQRLEHVHNG